MYSFFPVRDRKVPIAIGWTPPHLSASIYAKWQDTLRRSQGTVTVVIVLSMYQQYVYDTLIKHHAI